MTNQVAITMLKNLEQSLDDYCELNDEGKTAFSMAITALELFGISEQLPSVQPELSNNSKELENKNGELISRQEVIAEFSCCELTPDGGIDANYAIDFLEQLPPVQPERKRGKWILDNPRSDDSLIYIHACSECHAHHRARYDFCPSCGADMRSEAREYLEYGKLIAKGIAQGLRGEQDDNRRV